MLELLNDHFTKIGMFLCIKFCFNINALTISMYETSGFTETFFYCTKIGKEKLIPRVVSHLRMVVTLSYDHPLTTSDLEGVIARMGELIYTKILLSMQNSSFQ